MKSEKYTMDGIGKADEPKHEEAVTPVEESDKVVEETPKKKSPKTKLMKVNGTSKLRVRSSPDVDEDNVIMTLSRGDLVKVIGVSKVNSKFSEILIDDGSTAFVVSEFLENA